jgi:chromosome segregation ATPase
MRNRIGLVALVILCVGLAIALFMIKHQATEAKQRDDEAIQSLKQKWTDTNQKLEDQKQVTTMLEKDIDTQKKTFLEVTNNLTQVAANLEKSDAALKASQAEVTKLNTKINDLETQNQALDKQAGDLTNALNNLTVQIADTQKKLAASEGDKAFLEKELKRLTAEKVELEKQFNDIKVLRAQVSRLKDEMSIARRVEWIRQGLFASNDEKGAQKLMRAPAPPPTPAPAVTPPLPRINKPNYDLNVEVSSDGSVRVVPPSTNAVPSPK